MLKLLSQNPNLLGKDFELFHFILNLIIVFLQKIQSGCHTLCESIKEIVKEEFGDDM